MADIVEETKQYLRKYGPTKKRDLVNYLTIVKDFPKRTVKKEINSQIGKQLQRIIHPTQPPSVYLSLEPQPDLVRYDELEPKRAFKVARIDWILENIHLFIDPNDPIQVEQAKQIEPALRVLRDLFVREGKALGR